jgi:hypothetical protein
MIEVRLGLWVLRGWGVIAPRAPDRPRTELRGGLGATLKPGVSEID